jgi:O-antigen/teichoic acid export membrane protein
LIQGSNKLTITGSKQVATPLPSDERTLFCRRIALHPALVDFGLAGGTSFLVAIAAMVVISLVGRTLGPVLLGEYLLIRRMASWLQAGVQLPSGVALPRYLAFSLNEPGSIRLTYFLIALLMGCGISLLLGVILLFWRNAVSHLFLGSTELNHLVCPLALLLFGLAAHIAVFGYYQGTLAMGRASALQLVNLVVVPVLATAMLKREHSIPLIVNAISISMILSACFFALPIFRKLELAVSAEQLKKQTLELLSYGLTRTLGDVGLQAMLSLPAVVAAHYFPIGSVTFLLLGGSFLALVSAATLPMGFILLSRVSRSIAGLRTSELRLRVTHFTSALMETSAFVCFQLVVFSDAILRLWVGPSFLEGIRVVRIVILAVPFYFFFAGLQNVINAAAVKAYNTRNILVSMGVFVFFITAVGAIVPRDHLLEGFAASAVVGQVALAICTLRTIRRLFQIDINWAQALPSLGLGVILGLLSLFFHQQFLSQANFLLLLIYEAAVVGIYFFLLWIFEFPWARFFVNTMFPPIELKQEVVQQQTKP